MSAPDPEPEIIYDSTGEWQLEATIQGAELEAHGLETETKGVFWSQQAETHRVVLKLERVTDHLYRLWRRCCEPKKVNE